MTYGGSRRLDLAQRLGRGQRALRGRLGRPEMVLAVMRAAHESLDAAVIGEQVVAMATEWFKAAGCGVFAADIDGAVSPLAAKGLGTALAPAALEIARWVLLRGRELVTADARHDSRL